MKKRILIFVYIFSLSFISGSLFSDGSSEKDMYPDSKYWVNLQQTQPQLFNNYNKADKKKKKNQPQSDSKVKDERLSCRISEFVWKSPLFVNRTDLKIFCVYIETKSVNKKSSAYFGTEDISKADEFIDPEKEKRLYGEIIFGIDKSDKNNETITKIDITILGVDSEKAIFKLIDTTEYSDKVNPQSNSIWNSMSGLSSKSISSITLEHDKENSRYRLFVHFKVDEAENEEYDLRLLMKLIKGDRTILGL